MIIEPPVRAADRGAVLRAEILHPDAVQAIAGPWQTLGELVETSTCFMLPAYFRSWYRVFSDDVDARVIAVFEGAILRGVLPVMIARVWRGPSFAPRIDYSPSDRIFSPGGWRPFPVRQLSSVVSWPATSIRPTMLCLEEDRQPVSSAAAHAMSDIRRIDELVLPVREGDDEQHWTEAFQQLGLSPYTHRLSRNVLILRRVRPFNEIVGKATAKFRRNIKYARNNAKRAGMVFSIYEGSSEVSRHLEVLAQIARASWKHTGRDGHQIAISYQGNQQRFFETLLSDSELGMTPVLGVAAANGKPIAVLLNVRHSATLTALLQFRESNWSAASPGLLLLGAMIDWASANGVQRFDFNATQEWLRHIADERQGLANVIVFAPTLVGATYRRVSSIARYVRGILPFSAHMPATVPHAELRPLTLPL